MDGIIIIGVTIAGLLCVYGLVYNAYKSGYYKAKLEEKLKKI